MEIVLMVIAVINLLLLFLVLLSKNKKDENEIKLNLKIEEFEKKILYLEQLIQNENKQQRIENQEAFKENRLELTNTLKNFNDIINQSINNLINAQKEQIENFSLRVKELNDHFNERFKIFQEQLKENKEDVTRSLKTFQDVFNQKVTDFNDVQIQKFSELIQKQEQLRQETENRLEKIRQAVEQRLDVMLQENNKRLEEMRATVDEKLQNTLEKRLSESFKMVSDRLEMVHKGLGEMQSIASEVGDLKRVLSNVKHKGIIGEYQLEAILENILSPNQYEKNVKTKSNSTEFVEFAIRLPGKDDMGKPVYLPIDSKFPTEAYNNLLNAYDKADANEIKSNITQLERTIKQFAKDIHDKYIDPPNTTDFAIMFLPFEGLYAEVVRNTSLIEEISRMYRIIVAGPTTLAALLNSLQMGFRTLAIEKRSSEVWKILQAVKTEFAKFEDILKKAKEKIDKAGQDIDQLVGTRTRQINNKLRNLSELPENEVQQLLSLTPHESSDDDENF